MSNLHRNQRTAAKQARAEGFTVVKGNPRRLLLDLDTPKALAQFDELYSEVAGCLAERGVRLTQVSKWKSKSGGSHVRLRLSKRVAVVERLLLQACLGSDLKKEFLSLMRLWDGTKEPSMLFKPSASSVKPKRKKGDFFASLANRVLDDDAF